MFSFKTGEINLLKFVLAHDFCDLCLQLILSVSFIKCIEIEV